MSGLIKKSLIAFRLIRADEFHDLGLTNFM